MLSLSMQIMTADQLDMTYHPPSFWHRIRFFFSTKYSYTYTAAGAVVIYRVVRYKGQLIGYDMIMLTVRVEEMLEQMAENAEVIGNA